MTPRWLFLALVLGLTGCPFPDGDPEADVDPDQIVIVRTGPATITVMGRPGAVRPGTATTLTLTVNRPVTGTPTPTPTPTPAPLTGPSPSLPPGIETYRLPRYGLLHLGNHLPVTSGYAVLGADGGFPSVPLGSDTQAIQPGDELDITPQSGTTQTGPLIYVNIP